MRENKLKKENESEKGGEERYNQTVLPLFILVVQEKVKLEMIWQKKTELWMS